MKTNPLTEGRNSEQIRQDDDLRSEPEYSALPTITPVPGGYVIQTPGKPSVFVDRSGKETVIES